MAKTQSQVSTLDDAPQVELDAEMQADAKVLAGANNDGNLSGKMELLTMHSSSEDGGKDAVFVSHNGYAFQIPRDQPFKVPTEVVQILRDAKITGYRPGPSGAVIEDSRPRYAFSTQPVEA